MEQHIYKNVMVTYEDNVWCVYEKKDYNKGKSPIDLFDTVEEAIYYASKLYRTNKNIKIIIEQEIPKYFKYIYDDKGNIIGMLKNKILK